MKHSSFFTVFLVFISSSIHAQITNTNCANALRIDDPSNYCSFGSEYSNSGGGNSELAAINCFEGVVNDVYFSFTAVAQAVNIVINSEVTGNLKNPVVALYEGDCGSSEFMEINCARSTGFNDIVNLFFENLTVGENYVIRVGGDGNNVGSFQLCISNYNQPIVPGQDLDEAAVLCDKSNFVIQTLSGGGDNPDEAAGTCLDVGFGASESQSSWLAWVAANDGDLTFTITPLNSRDDIDFVLFELPGGMNNFASAVVVRCMAAGCVGGGPTGLDDTSTDFIEPPGCPMGNDNFLAALDMEAGKTYALLINNFTSTGIGVSMEFGGSGEFLGPEADFSVTVDGLDYPLADLFCDQLIQVQNVSSDIGSGISDYEWNFGLDAFPQMAQGEGPFDIEYSTFGTKYITLTATSDLACKVTKTLEIEVGKCCLEAEALGIETTDKLNVGCVDNARGYIEVKAVGGQGPYFYSFEGGPFERNSRFDDLAIGDYSISVMDSKGCENENFVTIYQGEAIDVDAGPDASIEYLGDSIRLNGTYSSNEEFQVLWQPSDSLFCPEDGAPCLDPLVVPLGTTTYRLNIIDFLACNVYDEVTITVQNIRSLYAPNVFSPNEDGFNDVFTLNGNTSALSSIPEFMVFDRWGNQVFRASNLNPQDLNRGWDGKFEGTDLDEGVYVWFAQVEYIDPDRPSEVLSGDITLIR